MVRGIILYLCNTLYHHLNKNMFCVLNKRRLLLKWIFVCITLCIDNDLLKLTENNMSSCYFSVYIYYPNHYKTISPFNVRILISLKIKGVVTNTMTSEICCVWIFGWSQFILTFLMIKCILSRDDSTSFCIINWRCDLNCCKNKSCF